MSNDTSLVTSNPHSQVAECASIECDDVTVRVTCIITKTCPCNIQRLFSEAKIENFIGKISIFYNVFAQNIDCGYTLEPPRRSGSNEYPRAKIRKLGIPLHTQVFLYKSGIFNGVYFARTCFPDGHDVVSCLTWAQTEEIALQGITNTHPYNKYPLIPL